MDCLRPAAVDATIVDSVGSQDGGYHVYEAVCGNCGDTLTARGSALENVLEWEHLGPPPSLPEPKGVQA